MCVQASPAREGALHTLKGEEQGASGHSNHLEHASSVLEQAILYKHRIKAENEMRTLNARISNSIGSCERRHNMSLMIHNNQLPDTGMHKMRTCGERCEASRVPE